MQREPQNKTSSARSLVRHWMSEDGKWLRVMCEALLVWFTLLLAMALMYLFGTQP